MERFSELFEQQQRPNCQLYLISPPSISPDFVDALSVALDAGPVAAFQLRMKGASDDEILREAARLMPICGAREVAFIVNDRADLAAQLGADGVHLGQTDGSVAAARKLLGVDRQIGVTCHNSRHLAMEAGEAGADYVAFGAFYPTSTKEAPTRADPEILDWWSTLFEIPCVAIGGITPDNAAPLVRAGADFLAVCSSVWQHPEGPAAAAAAFQRVIADQLRG